MVLQAQPGMSLTLKGNNFIFTKNDRDPTKNMTKEDNQHFWSNTLKPPVIENPIGEAGVRSVQ